MNSQSIKSLKHKMKELKGKHGNALKSLKDTYTPKVKYLENNLKNKNKSNINTATTKSTATKKYKAKISEIITKKTQQHNKTATTKNIETTTTKRKQK